MQPRILVVRGGAIGDFILTLPAIGLLREAFPRAHLEILGYRDIISLADGRYYADATRSIEYAGMAPFFARRGALPPEMQEYFAGFQQVVSFLFDPDGIFEGNLRLAGVRNFLSAHTRLAGTEHAARQLAHGLQSLALYLEDHAARVHLSPADRAAAAALRDPRAEHWVALHPGSGSPRKNWELARWGEAVRRLAATVPGLGLRLVGGEADGAALAALPRELPPGLPVVVHRDLPLPVLGAMLAECRAFLGHDSGISHLAAAVGTPCVLLFGSTDPAIWAPANAGVQVLEAPGEELAAIGVEEVCAAVGRLLA